MHRFLTRVFLAALVLLWASPAYASYAYYRTVTLEADQVLGASHSNFTVLVCANGAAPCDASVPGLNQSGGGAHVTQADGDDIVFGTNNTCSSLLNWEIDKYVAATGELIAWVSIPSLDGTTDTVIYMCYGDAGVTTFQGGAEGAAWDANFIVVTHGGDGTTLSLLDSSGGNFDGTNANLAAATGKIGGGMNNASAAADGAHVDGTSSLVTGQALTFGGWFRVSDAAGGGFHFGITNAATQDWGVYAASGGNYYVFISAATQPGVDTGTAFSSTTWHHVIGVYDGANVTPYVNGAPAGTPAALTGDLQNGMSARLGWADDGLSANPTAGDFDETRVSNAVRSADWITTEYNNQNTPGTFVAFGTETAAGGGAGNSSYYRQQLQRVLR